jgi:hypothetical protein
MYTYVTVTPEHRDYYMDLFYMIKGKNDVYEKGSVKDRILCAYNNPFTYSASIGNVTYSASADASTVEIFMLLDNKQVIPVYLFDSLLPNNKEYSSICIEPSKLIEIAKEVAKSKVVKQKVNDINLAITNAEELLDSLNTTTKQVQSILLGLKASLVSITGK